jgi:hypothetical protein
MISSEVQRTLVKSPPELWTELSDPAALGRHLGEFGEIRITRVEPEKAVEWEAESATGAVLIKPSGWGTRVTLTVNREIPPPQASAPDAQLEPPTALEPGPPAESGELPAAELENDALDAGEMGPAAPRETQAGTEYTPEPGVEAEAPSEMIVEEPKDRPAQAELEQHEASASDPAEREEAAGECEPAPEPRRSFLARLFRRRRRERPSELEARVVDGEQPLDAHEPLESADIVADWPADLPREEPLAAIETDPDPAPQALAAAGEPTGAIEAEEPEPAEALGQHAGSEGHGADISAEPRAAQEIAEEEVAAVLSAMLDRLGTAHHRPFSRS